MSIANNIKALREKYGLTQEQLGQIAGVSGKAVSTWELGVKVPRMGAVEKIANHFGITKSQILDDTPTPKRRGVKIPVLGRVAAGVPIEAIEEILDYEEIEPELAATGDFFALQIQGDSMNPRMVDGDVVIVRQQSSIQSGEIAIVLVNGNDATCKKITLHENGGITLVSTNPSFAPVFYPADEVESLPVRVIGKVVELRAKF